MADNSTKIISKYIQESLLRVTYYLKTEKVKENQLIESPQCEVKLSWLGSESWLVTELTSSATYKLLQSLYFISMSLSPSYKLHQLLLFG